MGWVAGFATAMEFFPQLMALDRRLLRAAGAAVPPPDADDPGTPTICSRRSNRLKPPADLAEAVEDLVKATLLLADVSRPPAAPAILNRQRIDVDRPAQHLCGAAAAQPVQRRHPGGEKPLQAGREADSTSICMRSTLATRVTGSGTGA